MMTTQNLSLYHLGSAYQNLLPQLYDEETGEINMEVDAQLSALNESSEQKCIAVSSWIKGMERDLKSIQDMQEELAARKAAYEKQINKAYSYLEDNMTRCGITKVSCAYFTLQKKENPYSTDIMDEAQIPEKFIVTREVMKTERKPDKNAIKEEVLKTGVQVPGAFVQRKTKLVISINKV